MRRGEIFGLAGLGFLLGVAVVVSWGRLGPEPGSRNPTNWLGLLAVVAPDDASKARLLFLLVPAVFLLLLCWWHLLRLTSSGQLTTHRATLVASCWGFPFAIGPVIGSRDAYAYVAQGELGRRGLDPTHAVVSQLAPGPLLSAVDPRWRDTHPPYGGVAIAIQKAVATADDRPVVSLLILRLLALVAVIVLVALAVRWAAPAARPFVIAATAANPLVLIHLVGGAHLDAVAAAFLMGGLAVGLSNDARQRWLGIILCTLGAMVKLPVGLGAVYLSIGALVSAGPSLSARLRSVAGDALAAAAAVGLSVAVSGAGLGWLKNFGTPGRLRTGIAPADIAANVVRGLGSLIGLHPDGTDVLSTVRLLSAGVGTMAAVILLLPRRTRDADRIWAPPNRDRLGLALLALGLLGPVLYGWYIAPALPLLVLAAACTPRLGGRSPALGDLSPVAAGWTIIGLSCVLTFATIPSLGPAWASLGEHPAAIVAAATGAAVIAALAVLLARTRGSGGVEDAVDPGTQGGGLDRHLSS